MRPRSPMTVDGRALRGSVRRAHVIRTGELAADQRPTIRQPYTSMQDEAARWTDEFTGGRS